MLEDRIYNYAKEGATAVAGQQAAEAAVQEFKSQGASIGGLGAGGNKPQVLEAGVCMQFLQRWRLCHLSEFALYPECGPALASYS